MDLHNLPREKLEKIKQLLDAKKILKGRTDFLYFVSDGEGGHRFSSSLEEHNRNIKLWKNKENE